MPRRSHGAIDVRCEPRLDRSAQAALIESIDDHVRGFLMFGKDEPESLQIECEGDRAMTFVHVTRDSRDASLKKSWNCTADSSPSASATRWFAIRFTTISSTRIPRRRRGGALRPSRRFATRTNPRVWSDSAKRSACSSTF